MYKLIRSARPICVGGAIDDKHCDGVQLCSLAKRQLMGLRNQYGTVMRHITPSPPDVCRHCLHAELEKLPTMVVTLSACSPTEGGFFQITLLSLSGGKTAITCEPSATVAGLISEYRQSASVSGPAKIRVINSAREVLENDVAVESLVSDAPLRRV